MSLEAPIRFSPTPPALELSKNTATTVIYIYTDTEGGIVERRGKERREEGGRREEKEGGGMNTQRPTLSAVLAVESLHNVLSLRARGGAIQPQEPIPLAGTKQLQDVQHLNTNEQRIVQQSSVYTKVHYCNSLSASTLIRGTQSTLIRGTQRTLIRGTQSTLIRGTQSTLIRGTQSTLIRGTQSTLIRGTQAL